MILRSKLFWGTVAGMAVGAVLGREAAILMGAVAGLAAGVALDIAIPRVVNRGLLRFSLRSLVLMTAVIAVGAGIWKAAGHPSAILAVGFWTFLAAALTEIAMSPWRNPSARVGRKQTRAVR